MKNSIRLLLVIDCDVMITEASTGDKRLLYITVMFVMM